MLKYIFHKKFIAFLFLGLLSSVQAFSSEGSEIRSKFVIYEVDIDENFTVSEVCDRQDLAHLKEEIKGARNHAVRDIFCFPKWHFFKEANDTTALFIVAFKELQEYKLGDDFMVTGEPAQIAKEIINFYKSDDVVQFNFKVDGVENIYYLSPKPAVLVEDIDELSFLDTDKEYSRKKINELIKGWHKNDKIALVKIIQNTFFDYYPENAQKRIDGDWGEKTKLAVKKGLADTDFQKNMTPQQVVEFLFRGLVKVTENNSDLMTQSSKDSIDDTQVVSSEDNFDSKTQPKGTEKEPVDEDASEEKVDTNNLPATLQNIDEVTEGNNSSENQKSLDAVIYEKEILQGSNKQLMKRVEELREEILDLQKAIKNQKDEMQSFKNTSIIELLEKSLPLEKIEFRGVRSNGEPVNITVSERSLVSDNFYKCEILPSQSLEEAFKLILENPNCFRLILKEYEEEISYRNDPPRVFSYRDKTLQIPVLEKQSPIITSLKSRPLEDFEADTKDKGACIVGIRVLKDGAPIKQIDGKNYIPIYLKEENGDFYLEAHKVLDANIEWSGATLEFVDARPDKKNRQICSIQEHGAIIIMTEKEARTSTAEQYATISRSGELILNFVPIEKSKGSKLVVVLNEFVGEQGAVHGLNAAISEPTVQSTQKTYFEGFLDGLKKFISNNSNFEELIIYSSSAGENNKDYGIIYRSNIFEDSVSQFDIFSDEYIKSILVPGREGTPKDIRRHLLRDLRKEYTNLKIISFGPSGAKTDDACLAMNGYSEGDITFFNIWARTVIDDLTENNTVETITPKIFFKCRKLDRLFGFRRNDNVDFDEISNPVDTILGQILGDN